MKNKKSNNVWWSHENVKCLNSCFWSSSKSCYSSTEMSLLCNKGIKISHVKILKWKLAPLLSTLYPNIIVHTKMCLKMQNLIYYYCFSQVSEKRGESAIANQFSLKQVWWEAYSRLLCPIQSWFLDI